MIVALSILLITSILTAGLITLVVSDASLTNSDLEGKRAYAAAQAGVQYYLGQLNANATTSGWWQTCSNDSASQVPVPGTSGETYSYHPVVNSCSGANAVGTVLDPNTGLLRMEFIGYDGTHGEHRTIIADFRPLTPLSYLWFTNSETVDPNSKNGQTYGCNGNTYSSGSPPTNSNCWLTWGPNDVINGPMYTHDQYYINTANGGPTFGRGPQDVIAASGSTSSICVTGNGNSVPTTHTCPTSVTMNGTPKPGAPSIPLPTQNQQLDTDAATHGVLLRPGTTTLTLGVNSQGDTVILSGATCTSTTTCWTTDPNGNPLAGMDLTQNKVSVIYAPNPSSPSCPAYDETNVSYTTVGGNFVGNCGDLYVSGTYSSSLTLGAADDVIATGSLLNQTDTNPTGPGPLSGSATLGLVANQYVRIYHPVTQNGCSAASNITLDAAILALSHSFSVDNYTCGSPALLTVHGAIAQYWRGPVGTGNLQGAVTGYNKNYNYDDRLRYIMPPYVFDLQNTSWNVVRETEDNS